MEIVIEKQFKYRKWIITLLCRLWLFLSPLRIFVKQTELGFTSLSILKIECETGCLHNTKPKYLGLPI